MHRILEHHLIESGIQKENRDLGMRKRQGIIFVNNSQSWALLWAGSWVTCPAERDSSVLCFARCSCGHTAPDSAGGSRRVHSKLKGVQVEEIPAKTPQKILPSIVHLVSCDSKEIWCDSAWLR